MARRDKSKKEKIDPFERARLKKLRSAQRREERKARRKEAGDSGRRESRKTPVAQSLHDPKDIGWLMMNSIRAAANKIMNESYRSPAPYWLSMPDQPNPPPTDYYPCRSHKQDGRIWYGFLFREHRDEQLIRWNNRKFRKELTPDR